MNLHLYFFDEHNQKIIYRLVECKETPNRYTPKDRFPYTGMSYCPKDSIGRVVGRYDKAVIFTERNDREAKDTFADYFDEERKRMIEALNFKQRKIEETGKLIDSFSGMQIEERS